MQKSLRPSIRQPDGVRVARAGAREVLARLADRSGQHGAVAGDPLERCRESPGAALGPACERHLTAALHVVDGDQVHVHADRDGGVASREAARRDDQVVGRGDAEAAQLDGHRRRQDAGLLERRDRLERVRALAVVARRLGREPGAELLGDRDQTGTGGGPGCELEHHAVATSTATGTPLVTMS